MCFLVVFSCWEYLVYLGGGWGMGNILGKGFFRAVSSEVWGRRLVRTVCVFTGVFPGGTTVRIRLQCRRCVFDPWVGKIPWSRKWQPTAVFMPGKFHGQRSLAGYSPGGCKELDMATQRKEACQDSSLYQDESSASRRHWPWAGDFPEGAGRLRDKWPRSRTGYLQTCFHFPWGSRPGTDPRPCPKGLSKDIRMCQKKKSKWE